jgi:hypothetical protein
MPAAASRRWRVHWRRAATCSLLWRDGGQLAPEEEYEAKHARLIAEPRWVIDGLGRLESLSERLKRASAIVLVDLPLWMHFWLAAERQIA